MNSMYKEDSFCQKGTLKQLQNLLRRQKVPKDVKKNFRAVNDFIQLLVDSHLIAAALEFFGMDDVHSQPTKNVLPKTMGRSDKLNSINKIVGEFIDKYVLNFESESSSILQVNEHHSGNEQTQQTNAIAEDGVFNYACRLLSYGLLSRNFQDATKEGDGKRTCRIWKFFMLHFKTNGRTKYALEAFNLTAQINATLTPRLAHQLMWNRMCNTKGGKGKNKELDLHNEHINRVFKDDVNTFRSNITVHSINRSGRAIGPMIKIINHFDRELDVKQDAGRHEMPNLNEDFSLVLNELKREEIFRKKPGRQHRSFQNISSDPFTALKKDPSRLQVWLKKRRKIAALDQAMSNLKF